MIEDQATDKAKLAKEHRHVAFAVQGSEISSATELKNTNGSSSSSGAAVQVHVRHIDFLKEHRVGVNVYDHYEEMKLLGVGAFSKIMLVKKKRSPKVLPNDSTQETKKKKSSSFWDFCSCLTVDEDHYVLQTKPEPVQLFALKMIDTSRVDASYMDALRNEIAIFKSLDHPNVIKAYETFERRREMAIIMELATGGDLYTRRPYTTEAQSIRILKQILSALAYMHNRNVMHRDLKFENVMFENKKAAAEIKVIDFGLSTKFLNPSYIMRDKVGTLTTVAPDVVRASYTIKADMWSIGVIAYMMLTGQDALCPGKSKEDIERKILNFRWAKFQDDETLENLSSEAKDFLKGLLQQQPSNRFSAEEALRHPWLTTKTETTDFKPTQSIRTAVMDYANSSELKKLALQVIAYQSHTEQTKKLRRAFSILDVDKSGEISYDDFKTAFRQSEVISDFDVEQLFDKIDFRREKRIDYTEFVAATIESQGRIEESKIAEAFERLDPDNTGKISKDNLREILSNSESDEYISSLLEEADFDGDGMVNYDDFRQLFVEKKKDEIRKSLAIENIDMNLLMEGDEQGENVKCDS